VTSTVRPKQFDIRDHGRRLLTAVPGAAVLAFDTDLCVTFAEGDEFLRLGMDAESLEGRRLPDVLPADSWAELKVPYEGALAGAASTFDFSTPADLYSISVSPLILDGKTMGAIAVSHCVTEQRRLELLVKTQEVAARGSERLLKTAFDRAPIAMSMVDIEGGWIRVNDAYGQMLGYGNDELLEKTFDELIHPDDIGEDLEWWGRAIAGESDSQQREERFIAHDGTIVWMEVRTEMVRDDAGRPLLAVAQLQNITERHNSDTALRDSERRMRSILDNTPQPVAVLGRDHRFQLANHAFDVRFGLEPGGALGRRDDEVLPNDVLMINREIDAQVFRTGESLEREDSVTIDGEDHVHLRVKFPLRDEAGDIYGVCGILNDITDQRRREQELHECLEWTERIHSAIAEARLVLHAQPIVNLASGKVQQAELLVRMLDRDDLSLLVPPGEFLLAAERFDLVGHIDLWVVARAIEVARDHRVEINLSGRTISDPKLIAEIERLVTRSGAPPQNIIFEITETAAAENLASAREFADRLRSLGCSFALDDFGVGFGSFTYLKHLHVDYLKIDIEFVRDLVGDEKGDRQVVQAIVGVARDFGIKTIAEGVEDQATLELLEEMGVDYAQGFWIGRPAPLDELWPTDDNRGGAHGRKTQDG
jgi:PAS domain S-box-containing protein